MKSSQPNRNAVDLLRNVRSITIVACLLAAGGTVAAETATDYNELGVEYYRAEDWDQAIDHFRAAYQIAPENETVRRNLCNAYQAAANKRAKAADFVTASDFLLIAISVDPENALPLVQLGSYYLRLHMTEDAVFRLQEAIELDPESVDAHELLGDAYEKSNNLSLALAHWEWVRDVAPERTGVLAKLEKAYREEEVEYNFGEHESRHFRVSFAPGTPIKDVTRVLRTLEAAYRQIGMKLGGVYPPAPINVVVYTSQDFARATLLGEHVGAVYDGKIRAPIMDTQGNTIPDDELTRRLFHEYTHVVVRYWVAEHVPWWLNEGLAETFSSDETGADWNLLGEAYNQNALFSLADLESAQLTELSADELRLAYAQSHVTVDHLWQRYGPRGMVEMLSLLAELVPYEEALTQVYRSNYQLLERQVANGIRTASR